MSSCFERTSQETSACRLGCLEIRCKIWSKSNNSSKENRISTFCPEKKDIRKICLGKKVFKNSAPIKRHSEIPPKKKDILPRTEDILQFCRRNKYTTILPRKKVFNNSAQEKWDKSWDHSLLHQLLDDVGVDLWVKTFQLLENGVLDKNQNFLMSSTRLVIISVNSTVHEELYHLWESQVSPHNYHIWILGQQSIPNLEKKELLFTLEAFLFVSHSSPSDAGSSWSFSLEYWSRQRSPWMMISMFGKLGRMTSIFSSSCFSNPKCDRAKREIMNYVENL